MAWPPGREGARCSPRGDGEAAPHPRPGRLRRRRAAPGTLPRLHPPWRQKSRARRLPLAARRHVLGPDSQTRPGPCWARLAPQPLTVRSQRFLGTEVPALAPGAPPASLLPPRSSPLLPSSLAAPPPPSTPSLAPTSFDQSWKQLGQLLSPGDRSEGGQEPLGPWRGCTGAGGLSREGRWTRPRELGRWRSWSASWATGGRGQRDRAVGV